VGLVDGRILLDLEYVDDVAAEVDFNVVMTGRGLLVEVQGTAEGQPYTRHELEEILDVAEAGIGNLVAIQRELVGE
jgi:ribonuclease PH